MNGSCPYSALMNKIPFMNKNNSINKNQIENQELEKNPNSMKEVEFSQCPYKEKIDVKNFENENNLIKIKNEKDDSDEELPKGGCPVMNGSKNLNII